MCSTELSEFARRKADFDKRGVKLIGLSIDSIHSHIAWRENLAKLFETRIAYPMIADNNMAVAQLYGMIHPGASVTATVRAVFLIDPKRVVRAMIYYPLNVGRNFDEILRVVDALQTADQTGLACPANWRKGEAMIVPAPLTAGAADERVKDKSVQVKEWYLSTKTP